MSLALRVRAHLRATQTARATSTRLLTPLGRRGALFSGASVALLASTPVAMAAEALEYNTSPEGLKWADVVVGTGNAPVKGGKIKAHYAGTLENGKEFDSSYKRGSPLAFQVGVGQVIKGWDLGILGGDGVAPMKVGGKRKLIIPASLGYGARGAGGVIPPNATLLFDVELVEA